MSALRTAAPQQNIGYVCFLNPQKEGNEGYVKLTMRGEEGGATLIQFLATLLF